MRVTALLLSLIFISIFAYAYHDETAIRFWNDFFNVRTETEYGSVGKDTVLLFCDGKFQIIRQSDTKVLVMFREKSNIPDLLLSGIIDYRIKKNELFVKSKEGYGTIYKESRMCRLYIIVPDDEFIDGYYVDADGESHTTSRRIETDNVEYLKSYDDFTTDEKKVFEKMKDN